MEKKIKYQNVIFKFDDKNIDRNTFITYNFKIYDKITKSKTIELLARSKSYHDNKRNDYNTHQIMMPMWGGFKNIYFFRVKDKWLQHKEFVEGEFYQGNLELNFYSMDCPDFSSRHTLFSFFKNLFNH